MIVVLDTNIWISALFFDGKPEQALTKAFEEADVAICQPIVDEIEDVAVRRFLRKFETLRPRLAQLLVSVIFVTVRGDLQVCRDPDDDIVLECARNAAAQIIISGDRDLLELQTFDGISILSADQYIGFQNC